MRPGSACKAAHHRQHAAAATMNNSGPAATGTETSTRGLKNRSLVFARFFTAPFAAILKKKKSISILFRAEQSWTNTIDVAAVVCRGQMEMGFLNGQMGYKRDLHKWQFSFIFLVQGTGTNSGSLRNRTAPLAAIFREFFLVGRSQTISFLSLISAAVLKIFHPLQMSPSCL